MVETNSAVPTVIEAKLKMISNIVGSETPASGRAELVATLVGLGEGVGVGVSVGVIDGVPVTVTFVVGIGVEVGVAVGVADGVATNAGPSSALTINERVKVCNIPSTLRQEMVML